MTRIRRFTPFSKILVPVLHGHDPAVALAAARLIAGKGRILLVGLVRVNRKKSLSAAALKARALRKTLRALLIGAQARIKPRARVSYDPWTEICAVVREEEPDLLILEWPYALQALRVTQETLLANPPCDIALVRGPVPGFPVRILAPVRGGPYAELALRLALGIERSKQTQLTSLHVLPPAPSEAEINRQDAPFHGLSRVLAGLPEVARKQMKTKDPGGAILKASRHYDLVVMGATARPAGSEVSIGPVAERILRESPACVIAVKTEQAIAAPASESAGHAAISILVDKWFAENTFHANEFKDLERLLRLKEEQGLSISLAMPALNEQATVGRVLRTIKRALMEKVPLLDEMVLIDSNSTDRTRQIAESLGIPVFIHQQILKRSGAREGKGEALWKSLYVTHGDLVVWIDTDITNIHPRFVYGVLGPLLVNPRIRFVKGFYRRPLKIGDKIQAGGGGRVTELTARPLLNLFFPELSGVVQPLSGEYGGRRIALEQLPFYSGYGVEIGLLIDVFEKFGLAAMAQVDLQERIHRNQPLEPLSKMSFEIIQAVMRKLEHRFGRAVLEDVNKTMKLIRYEPSRFFLDVVEIAEKERPPMAEIPEYRRKRRL